MREIHVWDKESDVYYALVCPCRRLERPGDGVIVYHAPVHENRFEPRLMFMESFKDHGTAYVRGLRAFAREFPGYKAPAREEPEWWRGVGEAFPAVRD